MQCDTLVFNTDRGVAVLVWRDACPSTILVATGFWWSPADGPWANGTAPSKEHEGRPCNSFGAPPLPPAGGDVPASQGRPMTIGRKIRSFPRFLRQALPWLPVVPFRAARARDARAGALRPPLAPDAPVLPFQRTRNNTLVQPHALRQPNRRRRQ